MKTNKPTKRHYVAAIFLLPIIIGFCLFTAVVVYAIIAAPTEEPDQESSSHYDEIDANIACEKAAEANANYPETVDFSFWDTSYSKSSVSDISVLKKEFTAKNAYGVPEKFRIRCKFDNESMIDYKIVKWR